MEIDSTLTRAETPEGRMYTDPQVHLSLRERVFARSWHYLGHVAEVPEPGMVAPKVLGEGSIEEPVLLVRDKSGEVRVLSNVCTHRGMVMVDTPGSVRNIRCGYHGRRFALDGRLKAAPGFEGAEDFPRPCDDLPSVPSARLGPLVFANLQPEIPFGRWIAPVQERLEFFGLDRLSCAPDRARDYPVAAPWIAYCDNYLEGMHIPYVHPGLAGALDVDEYTIELFEQVSLQVGVARAEESAFELPTNHRDYGKRIGGFYFFVFPNLMMNFYPWGLSLNVVEPQGVEQMRVRFLPFVGAPERLDQGAGADLDTVELEDEVVVERVARGLRSRLYRRGRYAPKYEAAVHHFHRLLTDRL